MRNFSSFNSLLKQSVKTNFNQNKISKNLSYKLSDIENESELFEIGKSLKLKISDLWKEANVINLAMPLSIDIEYKYKDLIFKCK